MVNGTGRTEQAYPGGELGNGENRRREGKGMWDRGREGGQWEGGGGGIKKKRRRRKKKTKHLETGPGSLQALAIWKERHCQSARPRRLAESPSKAVQSVGGFRGRTTSGRFSSRRSTSEFSSGVEPSSRHLHLEKRQKLEWLQSLG